MNTVSVLGLCCTVGGLAGYLLGAVVPYTGRAFSMTALMVGVTLLAVGRSDTGESPA